MASAVPTNAINDQAMRYAVALSLGDVTAQDRAEIEAWIAADTRHRGALARARAWILATEDAVVEAHSAPTPASAASLPHNDNGKSDGQPHHQIPRTARFGWGIKAGGMATALAASLVAVVTIGLPSEQAPGPQAASTGKIVALKDGSVARLSENARIQITFTDDYRRIRLLSGQADFDVAKDKARPFVVQSGEVFAQATGTSYSVQRVGSTGGTVKVTEGSVLVWPRDERDQAVLVRAHGMVTLDPGPTRPEPQPKASTPPRLPPPELAQISLDNVPVSAAVARFNRVNSTKIVLDDPAIGEITIIGLYKANDPEQFAHAVATIAGAHVETSGSTIVIKSK